MSEVTEPPGQVESGMQPQSGLPPTSEAPRNTPSHTSALSVASLILALGAAGASGWQWWEGRNQFHLIETEVAKQLKTQEQTGQQSLALSREAQQTTRELHARLALLENGLSESKNQQLALQALYQELAGSRDAWVLADIEQVLLLAEQQLQLAGNVKAAIIALESAETRLTRLEKPQFLSLRKAILTDLEHLKTAPSVDIAGLALQLDRLLAGVDDLKPAFEMRQPTGETEVVKADGNWKTLLGGVWEELKQLVRVRRLEPAEAPLLAPDQVWFLHQNLKLRLLSARLALLARDQASYASDIDTARTWVERYFLKEDPRAKVFLESVNRIGAAEISMKLPDITASLEAVRTLRSAQDKP
jgi:uroporphyrin-III C-methyltransferase